MSKITIEYSESHRQYFVNTQSYFFEDLNRSLPSEAGLAYRDVPHYLLANFIVNNGDLIACVPCPPGSGDLSWYRFNRLEKCWKRCELKDLSSK